MSIFAAIPVEVPAVVTVEAPRRKIDWVEVRARITQAVAEAYAEATDEEIYQKVMQPLIDARNGLIGTHTTRRRINPNLILEQKHTQSTTTVQEYYEPLHLMAHYCGCIYYWPTATHMVER